MAQGALGVYTTLSALPPGQPRVLGLRPPEREDAKAGAWASYFGRDSRVARTPFSSICLRISR